MTFVINDDVPRHLLRDALRRRWWIVLVCVVVVTGLVGAATVRKAPKYTATSTVLLRPLMGNALDPNSANNSTQVTIAMETEAGLVKSPDVATLVSRQLGHPVAAGTPQLKAFVPTNTETVQITFTARNAVAAREGAAAFASSFLQSRSDRARHTNQAQLQEISQQSEQAQKSLANAMKAAAVAHTAASDAQVQLYASRVSSLEESASQLRATGTNPGFVSAPATTPSAPTGMNPWIYVVLAALFGLFLGGVIAIWRERRSDVIRAETEDSVADVPILSLLPVRSGDAPLLLSEPEADPLAKDAYRRARVGALARIDTGSVIAVADLSDTDHAGEICANLGLSLAEAGHRISVVDAMLDGRDVTRLVGDEAGKGLSDSLLDTAGSTLPLNMKHEMRVLGAGTASSSQMRDLYAGDRFRSVLESLRDESDVVLVAAPPAASPEGNAVAVSTDGVILVVADGRSTHAEVRDVINRNAWLGVRILGLICVAHHSGAHRRRAAVAAPEETADAHPDVAEAHPTVSDADAGTRTDAETDADDNTAVVHESISASR